MQDLYEEAIIENGEDDETPLDVPTDKRRVKTEKQDIPVETLLTHLVHTLAMHSYPKAFHFPFSIRL